MTGEESRLTADDRAALTELLGERVSFDEPLAPHTSWKIGGPADAFALVTTGEELGRLLRWCLRRKSSWFVLGFGSNLLVGDGGLRGVVIRLSSGFTEIVVEEREGRVLIEAGGAASLAQLAGRGAAAGARGVDALAGIPGSLGGAIRMNAGTTRETGEFVTSVTALSPSRPEPYRVAPEYFYRRSTLPPDVVVVGARLSFEQSEPAEVRALLQERLVRRKGTQPLTLPNAGSCFRNPEGVSAGHLIEAAGLKGYRIGDAQISPMHANFIVNLGKATARDVAMLLAHARRAVLEASGVELTPEVHFAGVFIE
jgi:UDP-N-acetylmuramate dehydrogenase